MRILVVDVGTGTQDILLFDSVDAFTAAVSPHMKAFSDDMPNYTDGDPPVVQISEIRATS